MPSRSSRFLALISMALLAVLAWVVATAPDTPSPGFAATQHPPANSTTTESEETRDLALGGGQSEERNEVLSELSSDPEVLPAPSSVRDDVLRGRVVSEVLGSPLPGALLSISRRGNSEFRIPDAEERNARQPVVTAVTDAEGYFELVVPTAVALDVEASANGYATARRDHIFAGDEIEFRLTPAATLEGILSRAPDGAPVKGALVLGRDSRRVEQARTRTDINGRFLFEDLQPGLLTVDITPLDAAAPPSQRIELQAGQRSRLDLTLQPGIRIHGLVSDPNGHPIVGAEVGLGSSFQRSVLTDEQGHYEMLGVGGAERRDLDGLRARAEGFANERQRLGEAGLAQDMRIDFTLTPGRIATGRVVDAAGGPIEGVYVAGVGSKTVEGMSRSDWVSTYTDPDGRFELNRLHLLIDHQLFLRKDGYGTRVYDFPADEGEQEQIDYGELVLLPAGRIEGVLRSRTGAPLPDHLVKLRGANQDLGRFRPDAEALEKTWVTAVRQSRTDTQGRFHFSDLPGGSFRVTASVQGRPESKDEASVDLAEGGQAAGVELTLDIGEPIRGVVRTHDGQPVVGVFVQVAGNAEHPRIRATSGAGGHFELFGVTEDMGIVELFTIVASYNWHNPNAPLGPGPRVNARAGDTRVVLELRELVSLSGRVEDANGQGLSGVEVLAYQNGAPRVPHAVLTRDTSDAKGDFHLELPEHSLVDLITVVEEIAEDSGEIPPEPALLEAVASDAQGAVLRFAD